MTYQKIENNPILKHTLEFALLVNEFSSKIKADGNWDMARQIFKSGTAIGANVWEAQDGESRADFVHKLKIAAKEANETQYWLYICHNTANVPDCGHLLIKLDLIQKLLSSIIATTKKNIPKPGV